MLLQIKSNTASQKIKFLSESFPKWNTKEIAEFTNIPLLEVEKIWRKIKLDIKVEK